MPGDSFIYFPQHVWIFLPKIMLAQCPEATMFSSGAVIYLDLNETYLDLNVYVCVHVCIYNAR